MKYLFSFLMMMTSVFMLQAQPPGGVGIGTSSPHTNALLELSSTTKGFLLPRMTTAQRGAIGATAGLIVYDTDFKGYYHADGLLWRKVLNSTFWNSSSTRQWMYNTSDSVGIGTSSPDARLDVIGDVKTSARIDAGGVVSAAGLSSSGVLYVQSTSLLQGNVTGNGTASFGGNINSNASMSITDAAGILQFKNGATEKSYVQLSGDDLRMGTNSGNTTGDVIIRMNGTNMVSFRKIGDAGTFMQMNLNGVSTGVLQTTLAGNVSLTAVNANSQVQLGGEVFINNTANRTGIGTSSPSERLHVNGNLVVNGNAVIDDGRITATATTSAYNLLPLAYGRINANGTKAGGTPNFSSVQTDVGAYHITVTGATSSSVISATSGHAIGISATYLGNGEFQILTFKSSSEREDSKFHFIIYNP